MKNICVVTGGGSGMGLETAKILGKEQKIILVGRTVSKLENAVRELNELGIEAEAFPCDAGDRQSVKKLVAYALTKGKVKTVVHAAGVSPHMANGEKIFKINAVGTINIDEEFGAVMETGSCILNVSSMSAYMLPANRAPKQIYKLALTDTDAFLGAFGQMLAQIPDEQKTGMAYTMSKNFVIWYTAKMAIKFGRKGIRVVSISPGTFNTPMGEVEGEEAAKFALNGALGRLGEPEEIAKMMAFMVSDECSYLTGVDILYDGGSIASFQAMMEDKSQQ